MPRANRFRRTSRSFSLAKSSTNPEVNDQIRNLGIKTISNKPTEAEISQLQADDVVIIPAFGTEVGHAPQA